MGHGYCTRHSQRIALDVEDTYRAFLPTVYPDMHNAFLEIIQVESKKEKSSLK